MSKQFKGSPDVTYRVVVDQLFADGSGTYLHRAFGPFATLGAAKSCISRDSRFWGHDGRKFTARIEQAYTEWREVPND